VIPDHPFIAGTPAASFTHNSIFCFRIKITIYILDWHKSKKHRQSHEQRAGFLGLNQANKIDPILRLKQIAIL
jgi:hypothetical protein